ncbi:MAG: GAF domain-containing protein [Actinomycetota bacterium]
MAYTDESPGLGAAETPARLLALEEALARATESSELLVTALDEAMGAADVPLGIIGTVQADGTFESQHARGFEGDAAERWIDGDTARAVSSLLRDGRSAWRDGIVLPLPGARGTIGALVLARPALDDDRAPREGYLGELANRAGRTLDRIQLFESQRRSQHRTRILQQISGDLAEASTEDEIAHIGCAGAMASVDATAGAIVLIDDGRMVVGAVVGYPKDLTPERGSPIDDPGGFLEAVLSANEAGVFSSKDEMAARFPERAERIRSLPYHVVVFLQIPGRGGPQGVLNVTRARPQPFDAGELELLRTIARQTGVALERSHHLADLERSLVRERALQAITQGLARDRTTNEMAETLLESLDLLGASMGYVGAIEDGDAVLLASRGYPTASMEWIQRVPVAGGPLADAVARSAPVELASREELVARYPDRISTAEALGIHASVVLPVEVNGELVAIIAINYSAPHRLQQREWDLLDAITGSFAQALDRARADEAELTTRTTLERTLSRLGRLQSVTAALTPRLRADEVAETIVAQVMQSLGATTVALFVPGGELLTPIARHGKTDSVWDGADRIDRDAPLAVAEAFRTGQTVWIPTREEWRRRFRDAPATYHHRSGSVLAVPLVTEGEAVLGVLGLLFRRENALDRQERQLATTMGQHAAQALERAQLFESERHLAERATRMQEVAAAFAAATTMNEVAEVLVGVGARLLQARSATVGVVDADGKDQRVLRRSGAADLLDAARCIEAGIRWPGDDAIASRGLVHIRSLEQLRARYPGAIEDAVSDPCSWVTVPLLNDSGAIGFVHLSFDPPGPGETGSLALTTLVAQASQALDRARLFVQEQEVARVLQRSLLPRELTQTPAFSVSARYEPGAANLEVGGDWYDVIALSPNRLAIAIGDVVGRGLEAAAAMGQLRSALRALALQNLGPAAVLDGLEAFAERTPNAAMSTVVYGELDEDTGEFRYCCAGHPPPLLETAGKVDVLEEGRSPLLAAGATGRRAHASIHLAVGATLALYTDGLVERRGEVIDRGIQRLGRALSATAGLDLVSRTDEIVLRMLDGIDRDDDVALLCVCRAAVAADRFSVILEPDPAELAGLRAELGGWLRRGGLDETEIEPIVLATNEAVANAIEHGRRGQHRVGVEAWTDPSSLTIEVRDRGAWREEPSAPERGYGLLLIRACMDTIAIERSTEGTTVRMQRAIGAARSPAPRVDGAHSVP